jgi:hypothetical protein
MPTEQADKKLEMVGELMDQVLAVAEEPDKLAEVLDPLSQQEFSGA